MFGIIDPQMFKKFKRTHPFVVTIESMDHYVYKFLDFEDLLACTQTCQELHEDKKWKFTKEQKHCAVVDAIKSEEGIQQVLKLGVNFSALRWVPKKIIRLVLSKIPVAPSPMDEIKKIKPYLQTLRCFGAISEFHIEFFILDWFIWNFRDRGVDRTVADLYDWLDSDSLYPDLLKPA